MQATETNIEFIGTKVVQPRCVPLFRSVAWLTSPSPCFCKADSGRANVTDGRKTRDLDLVQASAGDNGLFPAVGTTPAHHFSSPARVVATRVDFGEALPVSLLPGRARTMRSMWSRHVLAVVPESL